MTPIESLFEANQRRELQARAQIRFIETMDRPTRPSPEQETAAERRVRILENTLERITLTQQSGMDIALKCKVQLYWFRLDIERDLIAARRVLRWEKETPDLTQRQ
jgi:hypothetical protein